MEKNAEKERDFAYYLVLFKTEGHNSWRASLSGDKDHFEKNEMKNWGPKVKITNKTVLRIDRLSGEIKPI